MDEMTVSRGVAFHTSSLPSAADSHSAHEHIPYHVILRFATATTKSLSLVWYSSHSHNLFFWDPFNIIFLSTSRYLKWS